MTRSLDCPPTGPELFKETQTRKRNKSKQATQRVEEEGDESAGIVDPDVMWRQTLYEP
ncbi:hypothetical protein PIB30_065669 [Stylosanthes scabra]|uniref:Uncharacterized protein n=1 Tax=Stylosanthes scabra TaxID=79078 RepID=A0ABU6XJW8_9FABA|nr:hypothetical protein [Stylosanthes scabra]